MPGTTLMPRGGHCSRCIPGSDLDHRHGRAARQSGLQYSTLRDQLPPPGAACRGGHQQATPAMAIPSVAATTNARIVRRNGHPRSAADAAPGCQRAWKPAPSPAGDLITAARLNQGAPLLTALYLQYLYYSLDSSLSHQIAESSLTPRRLFVGSH